MYVFQEVNIILIYNYYSYLYSILYAKMYNVFRMLSVLFKFESNEVDGHLLRENGYALFEFLMTPWLYER